MFLPTARNGSIDDAANLMSAARRLRFADDLEKLFRDDYFNHSLTLCRAALAASFAIFMAFGFLDPYAVPSATHAIWFIRYGLVSPVCLGALVLSFFPVFRRIMQLALSLVVFVTGFGIIGMTTIARPGELGYLFYPMGLLLTPMIGYSFLRLRFWYATIPSVVHMVVYTCSAIFYQHILTAPQGLPIFINNEFFILGANIAGMATCYSLELYARRSFVSNYLLDQERVGERRKRERTEDMLQILSQAIGGVIHDLGNPLTVVQSGAQTLEFLMDNGDSTSDNFKQCLGFITSGAQMLDYLRLSLMEQTRVLDNKPIPLQRAVTSIRHVVEAGARYQKPRFSNGHKISLDGEDIEISIDEKMMITVLMNLIGNALKYSDGEVRIAWRRTPDHLLIAVLDQGFGGKGISQSQAEQLFVAFGRLDSHATVEGTGLGLLSVRKIVEAHGGEVFIEAQSDDTSENRFRFSSAQGTYSSMLSAEFRTAFVIVCPLSPVETES
ncbi:phytochrome-like protein cph1 [Abditibacteriota bacterium]|nr:phytochrome-like protein cph1 [Abditibacteriota bacterium]